MNKQFFEWFDNVRAEAYSTPIGSIMKIAGFGITHTGGGCLCWERPLHMDRSIIITDSHGALFLNPADPNDIWMVSIETNTGETIWPDSVEERPVKETPVLAHALSLSMSQELRLWCEINELPWRSADEILPTVDDAGQRAYLAEFIERWEGVALAERMAAATVPHGATVH